jgi:general secretion pathway protein K
MSKDTLSRRIRDLRRQRIRERARFVRKRRGVALILVLGALVILTVFVTQLQEQTSAALSAAIAERDSLKAEYTARSAVNLSRMLVATEPGIRRMISPIFMAMGKAPPQIPVWAFSDLILGPFNDAAGSETFNRTAGVDSSTGKNLGLAGAHFDLKIVDEDSKINANAVVAGDPFTRSRFGAQFLGLVSAPQYNPIFEKQDQDNQFSDRATVCGAIVDYVDLDEILYNCDPFGNAPQADSAEDNVYQTIGLGYSRKNAALDSFEELRLVRGMTDDFWSTFVDPDPEDPSKRVMTIWGQDKINVNSANAQTILAIACAGEPTAKVCNDVTQMQNFIMGVTLARAFTQGAPLFNSPKGFTDALAGKGLLGPLLTSLGVDPIQFRSVKDVQRAITTESKVFSIYAEGVVPGNNRETRVRVHAVVDFRNAVELGTTNGLGAASGSGSGLSAANVGANASSPSSSSASSSSSSNPDADMLAALASDPAGAIVYYRIE